MPGSDHPRLDLNTIRAEPISQDVQNMIADRVASGIYPLSTGEVFFGVSSTYRVARVVGSEVMLTKLDEREARLAREESANRDLVSVYRRLVYERRGEFPDRSPNISIPELLGATSAWEMLYKCDKTSPAMLPQQPPAEQRSK